MLKIYESDLNKSLELLKEQYKEYEDLICRDHIMSLIGGIYLLDHFSSFTKNEDLKMRIIRMLHEVRLELHSLSRKDGSLIKDLHRAYTNLREIMKNVIINPETGEYDVILGIDLFQRDNYYSLVSILNDILRHGFGTFNPKMKEIEELKEKLRLLPILVECFNRSRHRTPRDGFIDKAASLIYTSVVDKMGEGLTVLVKEIYTQILTEPYNFEPGILGNESFHLDKQIELLDYTAIIYLNDSGEKLRNKLKFVDTSFKNLPRELQLEKFNYFVNTIEKISHKAAPMFYLFQDKDMKEDMAREVNDVLSEVIYEIEDIQAEFEVIKLYDYPKTDGLGFLDHFMEHLKDLLKFHPEMIRIMKSQIESLHVDFDFLRDVLRKIKEQCDENEKIRDLQVRIIGLAYQAEYIIDFYMVKCATDSRIMFSLTKIIGQIMFIKSEATIIYCEKKCYDQTNNVAKISSCVTSQAIGITTNEVVGFDDEAENIKEFLFGDIKQRDVVSIVGLPGLGKTTLAKKLYNDPLVIEHFDVRAWCTVSQTYSTRDLLLIIIGYIIKITEKISNMDDEDLAAKLYQSLKGRRYFIVIDDLWHVEAWNSLVRSLPNDENRSRILITSRILNVAPITKVGRKVHFLRELSNDDSWKLFQKKLRQEESFSHEILEVGKEIAKSCKGLPLAIVVIASLLETMERSVEKWKEIAENLSSHILSDTESPCKAIFELSYINLPDHLKSCFLYFGAFAEDEEIPVKKLKWLWIAEGFVQNSKTKNMEDVAEEYCLDLISRSLVTSTKARSYGGVKACRVHDLLRDFCLEKAKEESFLQVVDNHHVSYFSSEYDQHRLVIFSESVYCKMVNPAGFSVRSLSLRISSSRPRYAYRYSSTRDILSYLFQNFKLLKVLDFGDDDIGEYFSNIKLLIHLRYLAVKVRITAIPSWISELWSLQSLLLNATDFSVKMIEVPDSLCDMVNLRHVHINDCASFKIHANRLENSILMNNLETLSTPSFSCREDAENLLRMLPKLRNLKCIFDGCFPELDVIEQILSLKIHFKNIRPREENFELKFPSNLRRLTLTDSPLEWDEISKIGRTLPNLEVLKLKSDSRRLRYRWFVDDGDFPKLKYLKLSNQGYIRDWIASTDSFPVLEQLVLEECWYLKEIPPCFGEIPTLQMITVKKCKTSVDESAREIQREQHDEWQNVELKVYIFKK